MTNHGDYGQLPYPQHGYGQQSQYDAAANGQPLQPPARRAQYAPQPYGQQPPVPPQKSLTAANQFWYVLQCIAFGAGYFAKIPAKKALADFGMAEMTGAEKFWYALQCIAFGAGYFAKIPVKKALSEGN